MPRSLPQLGFVRDVVIPLSSTSCIFVANDIGVAHAQSPIQLSVFATLTPWCTGLDNVAGVGPWQGWWGFRQPCRVLH